MEHVFHVDGMHCGGCAASIERAVRALTGVQGVQVDLDAKTVKVTVDTPDTTPEALRAAIEDVGYDVTA
jgi:copper ion binding protein